jgi:predicted pyridoxine 5'-phosphate oxidase superfamily flavin-nucleotide-binding protein
MGMISSEIWGFVVQQRFGFIATVCPDGTANLSPKGTTIVYDDDHLAFADIHSPGTVSNLLVNPSIEINVVDVFIRKGYRLKGTATVLSEDPVFDRITNSYKQAGSEHVVRHIVLVKVDRVMPIVSPAYDLPVAEDEVKNRWVNYWHSIYPKKQT